MKDNELRFSNPEKSNAQPVSSGWNSKRWSLVNGLKTAVYSASTVILGTQTVIEINNFRDSYIEATTSLLYPVGAFNGLLAVDAFYTLFYTGFTLLGITQTFRSIRENVRRTSNLQNDALNLQRTVQQLQSTDKLLR